MKSNYVIAIPSHKRSNIINNKVLTFLEKHNIDKKLIHIFVDAEEVEEYKLCCKGYNIVKGAKGIGPNREW